MIMKIRNFLIRLLGGYTEEQGETLERIGRIKTLECLRECASFWYGKSADEWCKLMYESIVDYLDASYAVLYKGKKKVFVSLPISGRNIEERRSCAAAVKKMLLERDDVTGVVTPFDMVDYEEGKDWDWYMVRTIAQMRDCNAAFFCEGWEDSAGCQMERKEAERRGMEII